MLPVGEVLGAELSRRRRRLPDLLLISFDDNEPVPHDRPTPAERAVATLFFAPIGLGAKVVEDLPDALTAARQQLVFARFIGKMAVDQGIRQLRDRLDGAVAPPSRPDEPHQPESRAANESDGESVVEAEVGVLAEGELPAAPVPDHDELALPDFDQLPAAHIVGKLDGLTAVELDAVEAYERAHRHRRTVLGKIDQLRGA